MRQVYLIRHGAPDFPDGERMCLGTTDVPLGEEGLSQAKAMAKDLPPVRAVFSSPLSRAVQTAQAICPEVEILPGLREYHMGIWDGLTFRQIREHDPDLYEARGKDPALLLPGQEDTQEGLVRFQRAMEEAMEISTGDIAVVTHGGMISAFLRSLGAKGEKPGYAQVTKLAYNGKFYLV